MTQTTQTLAQQVRQTLAGGQVFSHGTQTLAAAQGEIGFSATLTALDSLACAFEQFDVTHASLAGATIERLKRVSEGLSKRLTYLLEPITPVEVDHAGCTVQLRSSPPQKNDDGTSYYELLVSRDGRLSLCRFSKSPGAIRQRVPAQVTREVFLRLVDDFAAAV